MKTDTLVQCMALERILPYGLRVAARNDFPDGRTFAFDLRCRLVGTVTKDAGATEPGPPIRSILCTSVLASAAGQLGLQPTQLAAALLKAAQDHTVNGTFVGDDAIDNDNPFVQTIQLANEQHVKALKPKPESKANSVRVSGKKPTFYANSVIKSA